MNKLIRQFKIDLSKRSNYTLAVNLGSKHRKKRPAKGLFFY